MMDISGIGIFAAFLAGAISFLSPCVLPLVPGYVSYIAGQPDLRTTRSVGLRARAGALGLSTCFVLGFSTVFRRVRGRGQRDRIVASDLAH